MNNSRKTVRMDSLSRQNQILKAALELAIKKGLKNITRDELADYTHISRGLIHRYFGGFDNLKDKMDIHIIKQIIEDNKFLSIKINSVNDEFSDIDMV